MRFEWHPGGDELIENLREADTIGESESSHAWINQEHCAVHQF
jgi:hypothetical protein